MYFIGIGFFRIPLIGCPEASKIGSLSLVTSWGSLGGGASPWGEGNVLVCQKARGMKV